MATLVKVTRSGQITIPAAIRQALDIQEGDYVEVDLADDRIILTPKQVVDKSQAYFWTAEWQAAEREADEDIRVGRVKTFESVDELLADLEAE
jgi:AbrB family looped-hinge helix DNA binding protein